MKDLSNEELINKFRAMCNLFIIYGKFQKEQDFNEANKISDKLLSRLAAGEEAVKKVAELENDKRELVEACEKHQESCRGWYGFGDDILSVMIAKHKEGL